MAKGVAADNKPSLQQVESGKTYYWCACGLSKSQPFCDGSHKTTDITPLAWTAESDSKVAFCNCKQTDKAPLCDGTHSKTGNTL